MAELVFALTAVSFDCLHLFSNAPFSIPGAMDHISFPHFAFTQ